MQTDPIVIVSAARTPMGGFQGELKGFAAPELGAAAIRAAIERAKIKPEDVRKSSWAACCPPGRARRRRARRASAPGCRSPPAARRSTRCAARA